MSIALDRVSTENHVGTGTSLTTTFAVNPVAGATVICCVQAATNVGVQVVDNGTTPKTFTLDQQGTPGASKGGMIFRADNITLPASGQYILTFSHTDTAGTISMAAASFTGVASGGPSSINRNNATGTTVTPGSVTGSGSGGDSLYIAMFSNSGGGNPQGWTSDTGGFTKFYEEQNGSSYWGAGGVYSITSGAKNPQFTIPSAAWTALAAVYEAAVAASGYAAAVLADSPVGYWRLGESAGPTAEDATGSHDGTYAGTPGYGTTAALVGDSDTAVTFSGDDSVSVADHADFDFTRTSAFSVEFWFNNLTAAEMAVVSKLDSAGANYRGWEVQFPADGTIRLYLIDTYPSAWIRTSTSSAYNDGQWHHAVVAYDGSGAAAGVTFYVDGLSVAKTTLDDSLVGGSDITNAQPVKFGTRPAEALFYTGLLDEVAIYGTALSAAAAHYAAALGDLTPYESAVLADRPVGFWKCDEASGGLADSSGHGNALTQNNTGTYRQTGPGTGNYGIKLNRAGEVTFHKTDPGTSPFDFADVMTFEVWVKRSANQGTGQVLFDKNSAYTLQFAVDNSIYFIGDFVVWATSSIAITDTTTWHHVVATKNGSTRKIYVDGIDVTVLVSNTTLANNNSDFTFGGNNANNGAFDGTISMGAVYSTALSAARVDAHYAAMNLAQQAMTMGMRRPIVYS